jgi:hypothetical protein
LPCSTLLISARQAHTKHGIRLLQQVSLLSRPTSLSIEM